MTAIEQPLVPGNPRPKRLCLVGSVLLSVAALGQILVGLYFLALQPNGASDYKLRHLEQFHIRRGWNPWTVAERIDANQTAGLPAYEPGLGVTQESFDLERRGMGGYPPWAMATNELLALPVSFQANRIYLALLDLAALAFLAWWSFLRLRPYGFWPGILAAASVLAMSSILIGMRLGQFTIIVVAGMAAAIHFIETRRQAGAGLAFCLAMTKPQMASLFVIPMLWRRAWVAVWVAAAVLVITSTITWIRVGVDPLTLTLQMFAAFKSWAPLGADAGLINLLIAGGFDRAIAAKIGVALAFGLTAVLVHRWRNLPLLELTAIGAVLGRTLTYHRRYDDIMLAFLLLALLGAAFRTRRAIVIVAFVMTAISVWCPLTEPMERFAPVFYGRCLIWLAGLWVLIANSQSQEPAVQAPQGAEPQSATGA